MDNHDISALADILGQAGYDDAEGLIELKLLPTARKNGLSLRQAMNKHAGAKEISSDMLRMALNLANTSELARLNIDDIVVEAPS